MAKNAGKLANRYAKALLRTVEKELGKEGTPTPARRISQLLSAFVELCRRQRELTDALLNPMFDKEDRLKALAEIGRLAELPDVVLEFLRVVFERDRIWALPEIVEAFSGLADQAAGVVRVNVTTASQIDEEEILEIQNRLESVLEGEIVVSYQTDPSLLGGMVLRFGQKVLDGSLSGRLAQIEQQLVGA